MSGARLPARAPDTRTLSIHRSIWCIAGPALLANLAVPVAGAVNTAVVGHLDRPAYLAAVAIGAQFFSLVYWALGFLRMGTTALVAQAAGADDLGHQRLALWRGLFLAVSAGLLLATVAQLAALPFAHLLGLTGETAALAASYIDARLLGAPAALAVYVLLGTLFGRDEARWALLLQTVLLTVNVGLSLLLVLGYGMGVAGVGYAAAAADGAGALVGLGLVARSGLGLSVPHRRHLLQASALWSLVVLNRDLFLRTLVLIGAFLAFSRVGASLGEVTLAANAVLLQFVYFANFWLGAFENATQVLVGRSVGRASAAERRRVEATTTLWAVGFAAAASLVYAVGGSSLVAMLTDQAVVREAAAPFLGWVVAVPVLGVWAYQLDGMFVGATRTRELRNAMVQAVLVYAALLAILVPPFGNHGLWAAFLGFLIFRALCLIRYWRRDVP